MTLRLNGSSSGFTEINAPAAAGSNTITLPTSNGSANQVLKNGSTAGTLEFVTHRGFVTYAIICDQKAQNTDGGTFTSGAWRTRDLNTEIADPDSIVSISSNQFTLSSAGSYFIEAYASSFAVNENVARLYNVTDSAVAQVGSHSYARFSSGDLGDSKSHLHARVTITGSTTFEIQHRCADTRTTDGFGVASNLAVEIYTVVKIFKEA
jgi:hypothetical protein